MTGRDRIVLIALSTLVVMAAVWFLAVAPERQQAASYAAKVTAANAQLATAEGEVANARGAQARYSSAYASIVSLGKAVPPTQEVPSLIYQLDQASSQKKVEFSSISTSGGGAASGSSAAPATAALTAFTQMPFTFIFNGSYFDLYNLFQKLNHFTDRNASSELQVSGRLLTIQAVKLTPVSGAGTAPESGSKAQLSGTITASAYVLPASQGLTGGATPAAPAGTGAAAATPGSPTTPAIARVTP